MKQKADKEFRSVRIKIFLQTVAMVGIAFLLVYFLYSVFLKSGFAVGTVSLFQRLLGMGYEEALGLYERTFRRHMDLLLLLSLLFVFMVLLLLYLRFFTRYLSEISRGMDALLEGAAGEISLASELFPIERKMNLAKHAMDQQKSRMLIEEQRKNDLIMYLAHDLKTPLACSISYLHLLKDEQEISDELREKYLSISLHKAQRLEELIEEFLEIAKYNLSDINLQYREINLACLLEQLAYELRPILEEKELACRLELADDLRMKGDGDKLQRVFDNLLRNAVIYSDKGTKITVTGIREESSIVLRFSNHGERIPEEKLERIFEQFYRLDTGRSTGGTGLGLAIARQIVTLHGGDLTAKSEEDLTVFTVTLPLL